MLDQSLFIYSFWTPTKENIKSWIRCYPWASGWWCSVSYHPNTFHYECFLVGSLSLISSIFSFHPLYQRYWNAYHENVSKLFRFERGKEGLPGTRQSCVQFLNTLESRYFSVYRQFLQRQWKFLAWIWVSYSGLLPWRVGWRLIQETVVTVISWRFESLFLRLVLKQPAATQPRQTYHQEYLFSRWLWHQTKGSIAKGRKDLRLGGV